MKVLRAIGNFFKAIFCLIYAGFFVLCCYSWAFSAGGEESGGISMPVIGTPNITFAAGSFPADSTELTLVLQPGETALLDEFLGEAAGIAQTGEFQEGIEFDVLRGDGDGFFFHSISLSGGWA